MRRSRFSYPLIAVCLLLLLAQAPVNVAGPGTTGPLLPPSTPVEAAVSYLLDHVDERGCIGGARVTAWATMAVAATGHDPHEPTSSGASLVDGLRACEPGQVLQGEELTSIQRHLLAIVAAGGDPNGFNGRDWEQEIRNHATSHGFFEPGQPNSLNNDIFGILSLLAAGAPATDDAVQNASDRLLANQNDDGGWSHTASAMGSTSDTDMTAAAMTALVQAGRLDKVTNAMQDALDFLKQRASDTHGSGHPGCLSTRHDLDQPDLDSTAWGMLGLLAAHEDPRGHPWAAVQDPWQCLLGLQHENGGFPSSPSSNPGPWPTAYVVLALSGSPFATIHPDMQRPEASFTVTSDPTVHQEVRMEAQEAAFVSWRDEQSGVIQSGPTRTWTPERPGIHNFTVLLLDEQGLAAKAHYPVWVLPEPQENHLDPAEDKADQKTPTTPIGLTVQASQEVTVTETVTLTIQTVQKDGDYRIDWGDGVLIPWNAQGEHHHTYQAPGAYTISVWARTSDGSLHGPVQTTVTVLALETQDAKDPLIPQELPMPIPLILPIALLIIASACRPRAGDRP